MKKLFINIEIKNLLFGFDLILAFIIPTLATIAIVPPGENGNLSIAGWMVCLGVAISAFTLSFVNSNNKPKEGEPFFPFQNTIFFLFPLGILTILEHKHASPPVLAIPYVIASPIAFTLTYILKQIYIKYTLKANVLHEIYSEVLEIIKIWKSKPKASLSSQNGKWIEYHFKRIMALIDIEAEIKLFSLSKQSEIEKIEKTMHRRTQAQIFEESGDFDLIKISGKTVLGAGYFLRKDIIKYLLDLYEAATNKSRTKTFESMRKKCPFYEFDEQPKSTARDWLNDTKYFIEPLWKEIQAEKEKTKAQATK